MASKQLTAQAFGYVALAALGAVFICRNEIKKKKVLLFSLYTNKVNAVVITTSYLYSTKAQIKI